MSTNVSLPTDREAVAAQFTPVRAESTRTGDVAALIDQLNAALVPSKPTVEPLADPRPSRRRGVTFDPSETVAGPGLGLQLATIVRDQAQIDVAERNAKQLRTADEPGGEATAEPSPQGDARPKGEASVQRGTERTDDARTPSPSDGPAQVAPGRRASATPPATGAAGAPSNDGTTHAKPSGVGATVAAASRVDVPGNVNGVGTVSVGASPAVKAVGGVSSPNSVGSVLGPARSRNDMFKGLVQASSPTKQAVEQQQALGGTLRALGVALRQGGGEVTMRLAPEALGQVKVMLQLADASVRATIEATTAPARQLLETNIDSLRDALEARGLRVDSIVIHGPRTDERTGLAAAAQDAQATGPNDQRANPQSATDGQGERRRDGSTSHESLSSAPMARDSASAAEDVPLSAWPNGGGVAVHVAGGIEWIA